MDRPPPGDVDDLATLAKLDEQILLGELRERYRKGRIYTYVGDILIAVNPFKDLGIYGNAESQKYRKSKKSNNPPHIFAIADSAYQSLQGLGGHLPGNQCILISGESGAGKTESTKLIIKQLINLCGGNVQSGTAQLEQQILQVNPLLEAFGNAQTNMNDNSSRFGKYIQLKFHNGQVLGAKISEYLLEKSRVVRQNPGEANFHIFYYLFSSLPDNNDIFSLKNIKKYRYVTNGLDILGRDGPALKNHYENLCNAMDMVGFTDEEQLNMFTMIASVLHLGNINFDANDDDAAVVSDPNGAIKVATRLLQIDQEEVQACLTSMLTVTNGEYVKRLYSKHQAEDARDAMAKAIYGRLFGWIVNKINCLLAPEMNTSTTAEIGILDIFGFEHFEKNSFEQACINLANEQLQFFFNEHIFKMEQEEYTKEGIDWKEIKFVDNKPLLDLFLMKPIGLIALLDEECKFPKGTDNSYVEKAMTHFKKNPYFVMSQRAHGGCFTINHYAGKVTYDASKWLEKNRDTLPNGIMDSLTLSNNPLVKAIFKAQISRTGTLSLQGRTITKSSRARLLNPAAIRASAAKRKLTVGTQFKNSLAILMEKMESATPVFVRCLKPNHQKKADTFMDEHILAQLLYTGMLETTKIRREGFAVRPLFQEFVNKYKIILCRYNLKGSAENAGKILKASGLHGWHIGKTKVFLKYWHIEQLAEILERMGKSALVIQRHARGFVARRRVAYLRHMAGQQRQAMEGLLQQIEQFGVMCSSNDVKIRDQDAKKGKDKKKHGQVAPPVPKLAPSNSINSYMEPKPTLVSCGTEMDDDDEFEIAEDVFRKEQSVQFGPPGRDAAAMWFQSTQAENVVEPQSGKFAQWFHGIISRKQSESLLMVMPVGCYLIRVSESRFGYTLSFKAEKRCRHYMIDQMKNGKFIIVGESKVHRSLHDVVEYHKTHHISNWNGLLTDPCGQSGNCDYMDLLDENNRMYFELEAGDKAPQQSLSGPHSPMVPPRNYTQRVNNRQSNILGRPLPQVPPQAYQRLIQNQEDQHSHTSRNHRPTSEARSRLSATRSRLH